MRVWLFFLAFLVGCSSSEQNSDDIIQTFPQEPETKKEKQVKEKNPFIVESFKEIAVLKSNMERQATIKSFSVDSSMTEYEGKTFFKYSVSTWGYPRYVYYINQADSTEILMENPSDLDIIKRSEWLSDARTKDWYNAQRFFPVFEMSDSLSGIVFELGSQTTPRFIKDMFYDLEIQPKNEYDEPVDNANFYSPKDSLYKVHEGAQFTFWKSPKLQEQLMKGLKYRFKLLCENHITEITLTEVLFSMDMCRSTVLFLPFESWDFKETGHPIMAVQYVEQYDTNISKEYSQFLDSLDIMIVDYSDSIEHKPVYNINGHYISYQDDFQWFRNSDATIFFPSRQIVKERNGKFVRRGFSLDLFGIPCD